MTALEHTGRHVTAPLAFRATGISRYPSEVESAVYYCCLEAIQNATKHAGRDAKISVALLDDHDQLRFEVADNGTGFELAGTHGGTGLQNIRDRIGALDGHVSILTAIDDGTIVAGSIPLETERETAR